MTIAAINDIFPLRKYFTLEIFTIMAKKPARKNQAPQLADFLKYLNEISAKLISPPEEEIEYMRKQLGKALSREIPAFSATPGTFLNISSTLYYNDKLTMGDLSQKLSVPFSTASRMIDWWAENEFVQRLPDPEDRRIVRISMTETGKKLHILIEKLISESAQQCLSCLTTKEQTTLLTLIRKVALGLKSP